MKNILIIGMTSGVGGVETFITNLINKIDKSKFKIDILLFQKPNFKYKKALTKANHIYYVPAVNKNPIKYLIRILSFYMHHTYDIVHLNECTAKMFVYCWPVFFKKRSKLIVHSHNGNGESKVINAIIRPFQQLATDERWSCSNEASKWMFGKKYESKYHVQLVKNGIDVSKYLYSRRIRENYRKEFNIDKNSIVIGSVARFERQKNHLFLLDIFKSVVEKRRDSILFLVGEGNLKDEIVAKAKKLNIYDNIIFLGNRNDVSQLLQMFDVVVMPSLYEGLPFVGMEAQAAGVPLVLSNNVDPEIKITDTTYFAELSNSSNIWEQVILRAIRENTENIRFEKRKNVKSEFVKHGYNLNKTIQHIEQLYNSIG